jgi:hypothetical protein
MNTKDTTAADRAARALGGIIAFGALVAMEMGITLAVLVVWMAATTERGFLSLAVLVVLVGAIRTFFSETHNARIAAHARRKAGG